MNKIETISIIKFYVFILLSMLFLHCDDSNPVEPEEYGDGDNYEIYSKILSENIHGDNLLIVIGDSTVADFIFSKNPYYFYSHFSEASRETIDNYAVECQKRIKLKKIPQINCVFSSELEETDKQTVHVTLSNVGFNSDRTEALVSMGAMYAPLAGSGVIIFLVKVNKVWEIKKSVMTWISKRA